MDNPDRESHGACEENAMNLSVCSMPNKNSDTHRESIKAYLGSDLASALKFFTSFQGCINVV